jgi:hypothetical protein
VPDKRAPEESNPLSLLDIMQFIPDIKSMLEESAFPVFHCREYFDFSTELFLIATNVPLVQTSIQCWPHASAIWSF